MSIFCLLDQFLPSCFFCAILLYTQKEITQIIERWKFVTVGGTREVYAVAQTVIGITVLHMLNLLT